METPVAEVSVNVRVVVLLLAVNVWIFEAHAETDGPTAVTESVTESNEPEPVT